MIELLLSRNSHARLIEPGPTAQQMDTILRAALRAPDHGHLRPWRFLVIEGERRAALGEVFRRSAALNGVNDEALLSKASNAPLRAPTILAGLLCHQPHATISREEQGRAVAAALYGAQLAAEAMGFGVIWRTGGYATDPEVVSALGGAAGDEVVGFLYIGTREGPSKVLPETAVEKFCNLF